VIATGSDLFGSENHEQQQSTSHYICKTFHDDLSLGSPVFFLFFGDPFGDTVPHYHSSPHRMPKAFTTSELQRCLCMIWQRSCQFILYFLKKNSLLPSSLG